MNEDLKPRIVEPSALSGEATIVAEPLTHALHAPIRADRQTRKCLPDNVVETYGDWREDDRYG